ncbi:MAG TPA: aldehyde ferredoxin oxidoreductase C-terminal domain-containing protein [Syntrophomonadaceae bacterium]|nr:aldehyde ferredoxin oxidoreductase C-terminal domain-containing protein [Syntrophomonadaceae bacterium]
MFIRVNVGEKTIVRENVSDEFKMLGARGLVSSIVAAEVNPTCDPLGPDNKIVFAPGFLASTSVTSSSRTSLGTKSPLTGGIKESSAGGPGGSDLAKIGIKALIIEGVPDKKEWYVLYLTKDQANLESAEDILGLGCYDSCEKLQKVYGKKCSIFIIGQAGEKQMRAANVSATDKEGVPTRQFGRGGVGAVMGAKHIKAVVIDASLGERIKPLDPELVKKANKIFSEAVLKNPVSGKVMRTLGTASLINFSNGVGALPTLNFSQGAFEKADRISGEHMSEILKARGGKVGHICSPGCIIACSNIYVDEQGKEITGGFEYESICLLGSNLGIDNLDEVAQLNRLCDDYGLDTIEMGVALGIAMEAGRLSFGSFQDAADALHSIARGDLLGQVLGQGAEITGKALGITRTATVKGQAMAAYDPRGIKGMGAVYATSPMGADHTASTSCTVFGKSKPEQQVPIAKEFQIKATAMENTGLCRFCTYSLFGDETALPALLDVIYGYYGIRITPEEFWGWGTKILNIEKDFNRRAGFTSQDDRIPEFMRREELMPGGKVFDITDEELDSILDF